MFWKFTSSEKLSVGLCLLVKAYYCTASINSLLAYQASLLSMSKYVLIKIALPVSVICKKIN